MAISLTKRAATPATATQQEQHYRVLLFGCANPRAGITGQPSHEDYAEWLWSWIYQLGERGYVLDWPCDVQLLTPHPSDQHEVDDILGVVIAASEGRINSGYYLRPVRELYDDVLGETITDLSLLTICEYYEETIATAMREWEIVRFAARAVGLDLPPGRLWLVEGVYS